MEAAIQRTTFELQDALLEAVAPRLTPPFKPIDVHKAFGVDRRLGWEISRMLQDADVFAAARHFPGQAAMRRFLRAAGARSVADEHLDRVREAAERFEDLVADIGGDTERFQLVLASLSRNESSEEMLAQRRAAFQASRFIYGAEASMLVRSRVLSPSMSRPGMIDIASVGGLVELRRLRPGCEWPMYARRWHDASGKSQGPKEPRPIEAVGPDEPPLLRSACVPESIEIERVDVEPGFVEYVLPAGAIGQRGAVTCLVGEVFDAVGAAYASPTDAYVDFNTRIGTPTECLVVDTFVHESLAALGDPELLLRNEIQRSFRGRPAWTDADTLDPLTSPARLGTGHAAAGIVEARWYAPMISRVMDTLDLDPETYVVHRAVIPYPPMGSMATLRYALPEEGTGAG